MAVLAIVAILLGITVPRAMRMQDTIAVERAARQIAWAHRRARLAAILRNHAITLTIAADSITIRPRHGAVSLWREVGPAATGVALAGSVRTVTFSSIGLAIGAGNATYTVTRGTAQRSVIVSRLGRVRIAS